MQEVFEKIIEKLEEMVDEAHDGYNPVIAQTFKRAIEIVKQAEEEYNGGWIPVNPDDRETFPKDDKYILLSFENYSVPVVGRYEEDENGGAFYVGDDTETCVSQDLFVNAWQPLIKSYRKEDEA